MDRLEAMRTLVAAVDAGSLTAASRSLSTPLTTISRRISDLEAYLGVPLLIRTNRKLLLTEAGRSYHAVARRLLDDLADAERSARGEYLQPRGELLVTAPIMFGTDYVAPIVHDFLADHPDMTVRLVLSDQVTDMAEAHIDVAFRIGHLPPSDLIARQVGRVQWVICASPDYLARHGKPMTPEMLTGHRCIALEGLQTRREWTVGGGTKSRSITISPQFSVNTASSAVDAAIAGLGIARIMSYQAAGAVSRQQITTILRDFDTDPLPVSLVHPFQQVQPLKRRVFLDYVAPRMKAQLSKVEALIAAPTA